MNIRLQVTSSDVAPIPTPVAYMGKNVASGVTVLCAPSVGYGQGLVADRTRQQVLLLVLGLELGVTIPAIVL